MFEYEDQSSSSVGLCLLQLFAAPFTSLLLGSLVTLIVEHFVRVGNIPEREAFVGYFTFSLVGFSLGYGAQRAVPRAASAGGRWVWILPVCVFAYALLDGFRRNSSRVLAELFISDPSIDEGIGRLFFTWPALASCFYSIGIVVAARSRGIIGRMASKGPMINDETNR